MALTARDIAVNADLFRGAYPGWPHPEPERSTVMTLEEVSRALRDAGFAEAVVTQPAGGIRVETAGFRAYEYKGTVRLGYWPADGEFDGVHFDAPGIGDLMRDMEDAYTAALEAAGYRVDRSSGAVVVTGKAA